MPSLAAAEAAKAKPHCADEIKRKTDEAFKDVDRKKYGRTTQQPPAKGSDAQAALKHGESHTPIDNGVSRRGRTRAN